MTVPWEQFADTVRDRAGIPERLPDADAAARAAEAVLASLASQMTAAAAQRLAQDLPERFALALRQTSGPAEAVTMDGFYGDVERATGFAEPDIAAVVAATLRTLVDHADREAVEHARPQLTEEVQVLLQTDTAEPDRSFRGADGPIDPSAPKIAGPNRPLPHPGQSG
jgi:uncharacterized protein (DUF2267 family)